MKKLTLGVAAVLLLSATMLVSIVAVAPADARENGPCHVAPPGGERYLTLFPGLSGDELYNEALAEIRFAEAVDLLTPELEALRAWILLLRDSPCPVLAYPGPFTAMPTTPSGPYGWGDVNITAGAASAVASPAAPAAAGAGATLAHTGAESGVLAYLGFGLLGAGSMAHGLRRKRSSESA